ncbi:MarR family winged helix-turn-helix transcriptional regulator [Afifella pfennigii]|uniref:MarR family winged helix-turn-helix transcriptional regulator n=1 Tax=Afifella pfennigii TaxID=209897 RepID=UPI000689CB4A|nr:MarR family winged helix-turn-helix transcriptional regulator [Afifella pfennigii]
MELTSDKETKGCGERPAAKAAPGDGAAAIRSVARTAKLCRAYLGIELARIGLHPGQDTLLWALRDGANSPGRLALTLQVRPPTVSKMLDRLAARGFVRRDCDPADSRRNTVHLTDKGVTTLAAVDEAWARLADIAGHGLSQKEIVDALRALEAFEANLSRALSRMR